MKSSTNTSHFLGLRTAIYHAPDLGKVKSWYSRILGFEPYFDRPFYVGFNVGGYELGLDPDPILIRKRRRCRRSLGCRQC